MANRRRTDNSRINSKGHPLICRGFYDLFKNDNRKNRDNKLASRVSQVRSSACCGNILSKQKEFANITIILLPSPNGHLVALSLRSIIAQRIKPTEVIAPSDAPLPSHAKASFEVIRLNADDFDHYTQSAVEMSSGKLIQWLRPGDELAPDGFKNRLAVFESTPDAGIVYGMADFIDEQNRPAGFNKSAENYRLALTASPFIPISAALFKRCAVMDIGPIRSDYGPGRYWEYFLRAARAGMRFAYDQSTAMYFTDHPFSFKTGDDFGLTGIDKLIRDNESESDNEPSTQLALLHALAVELFDRILLFEERTGRAFAPDVKKRIEQTIFDKTTALLGAQPWNQMKPSELRACDAALLVGHLLYLARTRGWSEIEKRLQGEQWAFDSGVDPTRSDVFIPRLQRLYEKFLRLNDQSIANQYCEMQRRVLYQKLLIEGGMDDKYRSALRRLIQDAFKLMAGRGIKRIAIFGAGLHTTRMMIWIDQGFISTSDIHILGIVDDNKTLHGRLNHGLHITDKNEMLAQRPDAVLLSSDVHEPKLLKSAKPFQKAGVEVVRIYEFEDPSE
jgi:hypothetical protein